MHSDILNNYLSKDVEVRIKTGDTFEGNIKLFDEQKQVVILSPIENNRKYRRSKEYGDTVLRQPDIIVVREILPRIEEDDNWDEDKMMKSVKYDLFSDSNEEAEDGSYFQADDKFQDKQMLGMPAEKPDFATKIKVLQALEKKLDSLTKK